MQGNVTRVHRMVKWLFQDQIIYKKRLIIAKNKNNLNTEEKLNTRTRLRALTTGKEYCYTTVKSCIY